MAFVKRSILILLLFTCSWSYAQTNRYMVFFKDKAGSNYSVDTPGEFLTERSIERRIRQQITVTEQDLPVNQDYIQQVDNAGAEILYPSRWVNGVLVECDASAIPSVESLSCVSDVELVAPGGKPSAAGGRIRSGNRVKDGKASEVTISQLSMLGIDHMHAAGFRGEGIYIAVLDNGFPGVNTHPTFSHLFTEGRIHQDFSYDFVHDSPDVFAGDDHGTRSFSIIGAYQEDVFTGGAYNADFILYVTEDEATEYRIEEYNWLIAAERADSLGADIISTSLGYNDFDEKNLPGGLSFDYEKADMDGTTAVITRAAQLAAERGIVVVCSAGNEGSNSWQTVTAPADAADILAVGGVYLSGEKHPGSSMGPTADGRIKPDVVALGTGVTIITGSGNITSGTGTSYSAPLVTSLVAGLWQENPELTNKEVMELVKSIASQSTDPDNLLGYGVPNFKGVVTNVEWARLEKAFEIFPNPVVVDTLYIRPRKAMGIDSCRLEIISAEGKVISRQNIRFDQENGVYVANCSSLPAGVYYLHLRTEGHFASFKLVKI